MQKIVTLVEKREFIVREKFPIIRGLLSAKENGQKLSAKDQQYLEEAHEYNEQLKGMDEYEVGSLFLKASERWIAEQEQKEKQRREKEEKERFYNQPKAMLSDSAFEYWSRMSYWSLDEALALSFGRDPHIVSLDNIAGYAGESSFVLGYVARYELVDRACAMRELSKNVRPNEFLSWLKLKQLIYSPELEQKVNSLGGKVSDFRRENEELKAEIEAARAQLEGVEALQKALAAKQERIDTLESLVTELEKADKELSTRERDTLMKLTAGMAKGYYGYNPLLARSSTVKDIHDDLLRNEISLDKGTIRTWLKEAVEYLPQEVDE